MTQKEKLFTNPVIITVLALFCCALWGSATPFVKLGYELLLKDRRVCSVVLFAGYRFFCAGILTVLIYSIARRKFLFPKKQSIGNVVKLSLFQTIIQYIFFYVGIANTSGVKGTVESGSSAFFALLAAGLIFKTEKLTPKKIIACIFGFVGIVVLNINGLDFNMNFTGDCFVLFSGISLAVSSNLVKKYSNYEDPVVLSGYQFIIGGAILILIGFAFGGNVFFPSLKGILILIYLSFLSATAYSVWGLLLKYNPVSKVTVFSFATPIMGVILSYLMLSEKANVTVINLLLTLILVCSGIIMINLNKE